MSTPKRITELLLETLKDVGLSYGVAALAVPYLQGCSHIGSLKDSVAYQGVSVFAMAVSEIAIARTGTELLRRFPARRPIRIFIFIATLVAAFLNAFGIWFATDNSYHPVTHYGWWDNAVGAVIDRFAFASDCHKP